MDRTLQESCLNCGIKIPQPKKGRKKVYCNENCRSNYWQKTQRKLAKLFLEKTGEGIKVSLTDLTEPTGVKKPVEQLKTNFVIDTTVRLTPMDNPGLIIRERLQPPPGLTGLALRIWKDNHK